MAPTQVPFPMSFSRNNLLSWLMLFGFCSAAAPSIVSYRREIFIRHEIREETHIVETGPSKKAHSTGTPQNGIGLVVEGLERSDFGLSNANSDYQRSRAALGYQSCDTSSRSHSMARVFYESQRRPSNYEPEAIRVLCLGSGRGMSGFCACNEAGECFVPRGWDVPTYVEMAPFCDERAGCHVYMELYLGSLHSEHNHARVHWHQFDAGPFGWGSPYMKVRAVSCNGCGQIRSAKNCDGGFVANGLEVQRVIINSN